MYGAAVESLRDFLHDQRVAHVKKDGCPPGQCSICMYGSERYCAACYSCPHENSKLRWFDIDEREKSGKPPKQFWEGE